MDKHPVAFALPAPIMSLFRVSTITPFVSKTIVHARHVMNCPGKRSTRSTSTSDNADSALAHHTKDALDQVKEEVAKVCSVNKGTEKKIAELIGYLDEAPTEVGIVVSSYTRALFTIVYTKAIKNELKGLEEDVKEGFASLQSTIDGLKNQIQSSMQDWERNWERKFGSSASAPNLCVTF